MSKSPLFMMRIPASALFLVVLASCSPSPQPASAPVVEKPQIQPADFAAGVAARAGAAANPRWARIQSDGEYRLSLYYRAMPAGHAEVEADTKAIARDALKELQAHGIDPRVDHVTVGVSGRMDERGETGASMVRVFGRTRYNWANDSLEYTRQK